MDRPPNSFDPPKLQPGGKLRIGFIEKRGCHGYQIKGSRKRRRRESRSESRGNLADAVPKHWIFPRKIGGSESTDLHNSGSSVSVGLP
ncbi:hypothetical protein L1049_014404 [Liquidambar formosana]|uniref:Uncharacterized protein n=1 Tax=Liquidambar formosana TaxID=63359 RepID=A0AAP0WXN6_LIQFO